MSGAGVIYVQYMYICTVYVTVLAKRDHLRKNIIVQ